MIQSRGIVCNNNYIDIIHDACKLCYKSKPEETMEKKLSYIEHKVKVGHESVLEHGNIIMLFESNNVNDYKDYAEILEASKHLNAKSYYDDGIYYYLISGNIRAFKNIFRNMYDKNELSLNILNELYTLPREFFYDFIQAGIMDYSNFIESDHYNQDDSKFNIITKDKYNITGIDSIEDIKNYINKEIIGKDVVKTIDILKMATCTVFFKSISRIISQQLTRHRNAISQKSQRYVDEEGCKFINPTDFKDIYDKEEMYDIISDNKTITSTELGEICTEIYKDLRDQGMKKEDARYYLPQGVETELYVTFTLIDLIHCLSIRVDKSAQAEIREIMIDILGDIEFLLEDGDLFKYLIPRYMYEDNTEYEEMVEEIID